MRTTLDLDEDVLASAKEIARRENKTAGQVLSDLARLALTQGLAEAGRGGLRGVGVAAAGVLGARPVAAHGFEPFAARGAVVSNDTVNRLRDEGEY